MKAVAALPESTYDSSRVVALHSIIRVYQYIGITVHLYTDACTGAPVHRYDNTQVQGWTGTPVHLYTSTRAHRYTGALVHMYTNTLVYRYTGTPIPRDTNTRVGPHGTCQMHRQTLNGRPSVVGVIAEDPPSAFRRAAPPPPKKKKAKSENPPHEVEMTFRGGVHKVVKYGTSDALIFSSSFF